MTRQSTERITWSKKNGTYVNHGKPSAYSVHGCRCDECFDALVASGGYERKRSIQAAATVKRGSA